MIELGTPILPCSENNRYATLNSEFLTNLKLVIPMFRKFFKIPHFGLNYEFSTTIIKKRRMNTSVDIRDDII